MIEIKIKNDDPFLPKGMKLEIVKKKKINNRLYRFVIKHEDHKYVDIQHVINCQHGYGYSSKTDVLEIVQPCYEGKWKSEDYDNGKVQGGQIEITGIEDVIFSFTNLKYEILVFMILDPFKEKDV